MPPPHAVAALLFALLFVPAVVELLLSTSPTQYLFEPSSTTALALDLVRSSLPSHALAALRLASRAARDDLVDAHCTRLRALQGDADLCDLLGAAPRLRRLQRLIGPEAAGTLEDFAEFRARLPDGGAALDEVLLPGIKYRPVSEGDGEAGDDDAAAAAADGPPRLTASLYSHDEGVAAGPPRLADLLPLGRVADLDLGCSTVAILPQLFEREAAAALTALRSLSLIGDFDEPDEVSSDEDMEDGGAQEGQPLAPPVWHAPWLARLTSLHLAGCRARVRSLGSRLAPAGSLPAVRELSVELPFDNRALPQTVFEALLAACSPAALGAVTLIGAEHASTARALEAWPALKSLNFYNTPEDAGERPGEAFEELAAARLAPLTRLTLCHSVMAADENGYREGAWLFEEPSRLAALLSAPWAASLEDLCVRSDGSWDTIFCDHEFRALAALSQLRRLRTFRMHELCLETGLLERAAAEGWADAWAPQITCLVVEEPGADADMVRALLRLPLSRLERLDVGGGQVERLSVGDREELERECMHALPTLRQVSIDI